MKKTLYLIDGHAQIYRAYFAVMGLSSPSGEPTNATFGFSGMLLKLFQTRKPTHVAMALDAGAVAREAMDKNYKAQRKPMPDDMPIQIDRICQIMEAAGIPILRHEGCEADDVIATLVCKIRQDPAHADTMIYMCSKDKDLDQLIDERTKLFDIQTGEEIGPAELLAKKGYTPAQAKDVLALTGDTVDNIPGVPGVGPKTAAKWIGQYGGLDELIAKREEIKGKAGEALRANLETLEQARRLVELMCDLPIELDWKAAEAKVGQLARMAPIFRELGFGRIVGQLEEIVGQARAENVARPGADIPGGLFGDGAAGAAVPSVQEREVPAVPATVEPAQAMQTDASLDASAVPADRPLCGVAGDYRLVNTPALLEEMLATLREQLGVKGAALAVDTETTALGAMRSELCGISLSAKEGTGYYVAVKGVGEVLDGVLVRDRLGPLLSDESVPKVGQNLKYDINALRVFGIELRGMFLDTMVASYVLDSSRLSHGMDALAADYLGLRPIPISDLIGKGAKQISFADVPLEQAAHYSSEDADVTLRLANLLYPKLQEQKLDGLCMDVEMPLVQVLADMEYRGVAIDAGLLATMSEELGKKLVDLVVRIKAAAGVEFNVDSPKQLADVLFKQLNLPVVKKTKTGASTDIDVLEELSTKHPVPALVVEYRQLSKLKNTYLDTLGQEVNARTGRIHASFNQTIAATGRLSSSDPNLQNIPMRTEVGREIRRAFVAGDEGHLLLTADYSQIELRMLAHYCGDPALLRAFAEDRDVHRVVAAEIFNVPEEQVTSEQRGIAKTVNFGIIYGQTGFGLSRVLKIPQGQANDFIAAYKKRFPQIERFGQECVKEASLQGYVTTILGRRRMIPDINSSNMARRQFGQRAAMNSVIQGSAADLIKMAMVNLHRKLMARRDGGKADAWLIMQIHDELVFEVKQEAIEELAALVRQEMEHAMELKVPLKVGMAWGRNWLEGK